MKTFRKTPLSLAVAASLGMAVSAFEAGAVNLATDGIGEVAIAPYYTTRNGWMTLINLTNTESEAIVVKVRIHEGHNTRDVLDFNIALSPNDMWAGVLQEKGGKPTLTAADKSCIIGTPGTDKALNAQAFAGTDSDGGKGSSDPNSEDAIDRMREGYIEFIVMGHTATSSTIGAAIKGHNCSAVRQAFTKSNILSTAQQFGEPINALKFNFRFINAERGIEAGGQAVTWANFFNHLSAAGDPGVADGPAADYQDGGATPATNANCTIDRGAQRRMAGDWDPTTAATVACRNLITAQETYDFLEPSLNDAFPRVGVVYDDKTNSVWRTTDTFLRAQGLTVNSYGATPQPEARGVDAFSATIQRASVINEWVVAKGEEGTEAEWVVTFPTKAFYVDSIGQRQAAIGALAEDGSTVARRETVYTGRTAPYAPFGQVFPGRGTSCNQVSFTVFDREEGTITQVPQDTIVDSPAAPETVERNSLCYETNVLKFSQTSGVLGSKLATVVNVGDLGRGWMELDLTVDDAARTGLPVTMDGTAARTLRGLPAVGFMIKNRDRGNPEINYVSTIKHAYTRWGVVRQ